MLFRSKPAVDGKVTWPGRIQIVREDDARRVNGNGLPNHPTGIYPIARDSEAFRYDRNPNSIAERPMVRTIPALPVQALSASCLPLGPIGVMLTGVAIFNALDALGKDAVAHEIQDACKLVPLSAWGKPYTPPAGKVDPSIDMKTAVRDQVNRLDAKEYFTLLAQLMKTNQIGRAHV